MIKNLLIFSFFFIQLSCFSGDLGKNGQITAISENYAKRIVDAIYIIEGGDKTKYPYGIKSIDTKGNKEYARKICYNTVKNNWIRWQRAGSNGNYLDFLGNKYCPQSVDYQGLRGRPGLDRRGRRTRSCCCTRDMRGSTTSATR